MTQPRLAIVPASAMPPDPGANDKIPTQRAIQAPTVRDAAYGALQIASVCRQWIGENENLIAAMARLINRLSEHVHMLEEKVGIDADKTLKAEVAAAVAAAQQAAQPPAKIQQPPPKGLRTDAQGTPELGEHALVERPDGNREWIVPQPGPEGLAAALAGGSTLLGWGTKPPTQGIGFNGPIPKVSDPDVASPSLGQPPEKPA